LSISTQIKQCGHTFNQEAITNWFQSNVRCPVCRYDIREWSDVSGNTINNEQDENEQASSQQMNTLIGELTTGLNNVIQTYMNTEYNRDSINNYLDSAVYTFTIPLTHQEGIDVSNTIHSHEY
jgi:hypothetical protein